MGWLFFCIRTNAVGVFAVTLGMVGCAVDPKPAFRDVDAAVFERTGHRVYWNQDSKDDQQAAMAIHDLLAAKLTVDSAVQIALLNNHDLQAAFERIGIAQADLVQAGLLRNPEFAASWRVPDHSPRQTDAEYAVSQDFLDILVLPLRKKIAEADLERTKCMVTDEVFKLATNVKTAFYTVQAQQQLLDRLKMNVDVNQTAMELSRRQNAAGTSNDLDLANQQAFFDQSRLDVLEAELDLKSQRQKLNRLLGISGPQTQWTVSSQLPDIPDTEPPLDDLETRALSQRLDVQAAKQEVASLAQAAKMTEDFRYLTTLKFGVDTERNPGGPTVTGPILNVELPIFDQGQARVAVAQGQYRMARQELIQQVINVRSEVQEAGEKLQAQRELALYYRNTLLPCQMNIVEQIQLHYNAMLKGTYDLLSAKQNEITIERSYVQAWRDYWIARAELEQAVGGRFSAVFAMEPATRPNK